MLAIFLLSLLAISAVSAADNDTSDVTRLDDICIEEIPIIEQADCDLIGVDNGSFTALQNKIKNASSGSTINLENDYAYDEGFSVRGIEINIQLTINGNGHTIDGKNAARIFKIIYSSDDYVTIRDINFINGRISGEGGAIHGHCNVINCTFTSNSAVDGGAIAYASAQNCTFTSNTANPTNFPHEGDDIVSEEWSGGAIFKGSAQNCTFTSNTAYYGGAIYGSPARNCIFTQNTALDAGAMHGGSASNCRFIKNSAKREAGAFKRGMALNCTFIGNHAGSTGGAMYGGSAQNSSFINNTVYKVGGAICAAYGDESYAINCIFINNSAMGSDSDGGALYNCFAKDCIFTNNSATSYGGAMFMNSSVNCTFNKNRADNGGAIYDGSAINCTFNGNDALGVMEYWDDYGNPVNGGNGGAMYFGGPAKNCTFNGNYAHNKGGAVYEVSCENCTFNNNRDGFTSIESLPVTTTYNVNRFLIVTLKDSEGKPIRGVNITVNLKGIKTFKIHNNGQVKIQIATLVPKTYVAKITFEGNQDYAKSAKSVKVTVKKATPKLTAKVKTFKKSVKTKKYTVTLKTNQNKVMKNTKLTLKVNGKTYSATTNAKGQATFKITKLTKKGKFTAVVKFAGNKYYNAKTVKPNIIVK